jgi:glutamyl-tRNA synthetase
VEFDHLISKAKLTDEENFRDFLTPVTRAETSALADPCIRAVHEGQVVQFERKGFFRCDRAYGGSPDKPAVFFLIPDGKMKAMSTLTSALGHK